MLSQFSPPEVSMTPELARAMAEPGNCYEVALWLAHANGLTVCHGSPVGTGGEVEGLRYGHAWCEDGSWVVDASQGEVAVLPKSYYYAVGSIRESEVKRYGRTEALCHAVSEEHYGPWEEGLTPGGE
jgi:hypothetical protein